MDGHKNVTTNFIYSPPIILQSPFDRTLFSVCSLYSLPFFSWTIGETFKGYEIHFSTDIGFSSIPVKVETSSIQTTMTLANWEVIMKIPGNGGGTIYWRVVGARADKTTFTSEVRSMFVEPPESVGDPTISPTGNDQNPSSFGRATATPNSRSGLEATVVSAKRRMPSMSKPQMTITGQFQRHLNHLNG